VLQAVVVASPHHASICCHHGVHNECPCPCWSRTALERAERGEVHLRIDAARPCQGDRSRCRASQDVAEGSGECPANGQEIIFDYIAYNESGVRIDSSYNKGRPASIRLGINGLIPGARGARRREHPEAVRVCRSRHGARWCLF